MSFRRAFSAFAVSLAVPTVALAQDARQIELGYEITFAGISGFRIDVTARLNGATYDVESSTFKVGALKAMNDTGDPALPVHDALIVPARCANRAVAKMVERFEQIVGRTSHCSVKLKGQNVPHMGGGLAGLERPRPSPRKATRTYQAHDHDVGGHAPPSSLPRGAR